MSVTLGDFYPPRAATMEDFYPDGAVCFVEPKERLSPDSARALLGLALRVREGVAAQIEILTLMERCTTLLSHDGVKFYITRHPPLGSTAPGDPALPGAAGAAEA